MKNPSKIVLDNWLLNPTGNPESWVELDLVQEHLNYWIKVSIYHLLFFNTIFKLTSQFKRHFIRHTVQMHLGSG